MPIIPFFLGGYILGFLMIMFQVSGPSKLFTPALWHHAKFVFFFLPPSLRYLLEQDFPGMRIGPEPTTDSFIAVMYGETEGNTPGNALVVDPKKPFRKLGRFGNAFLNR